MILEMLLLTLAAGAGFAAGAVFYGGLSWTVRRLATSQVPALLAGGSFLVRTGAVLGTLALVGHGDYRRMLAAAGGFVAARLVLVPRLRDRVASAGEGGAT
jgi:F1F0 ATPase subunit 2